MIKNFLIRRFIIRNLELKKLSDKFEIFKRVEFQIAKFFIHSFYYVEAATIWCKAQAWKSRLGQIVPIQLDFADVEGQPIRFASGKPTSYLHWTERSRSQANYDAVVRGIKRAMFYPEVAAVVPTDEYLYKFIINTPTSYKLKAIPESTDFDLDLSELDLYHSTPDRFFDVRSVRLGKDHVEYIKMKNGQVVRPECSDWDKAKLHVISTMNLVFPALSHNWVHFHFVDIATVMCHNMFPIGGRLHEWLSPFTVANLSTNANGKGGGVMDRRMGEKSLWKDYFVINHTSNDYFVKSVSSRSMSFYTGVNNLVDGGPIGFGFPPKFPEVYKEIRYIQALSQGFKVTKDYVYACLKNLSSDDIALLEEWKYQVTKRTTGDDKLFEANLSDMLSTFIWQVCWVHTLDHQTYFKWVDGLNSACGTAVPFYSEDALFSHMDQIQFKNMSDIAIRYNSNGDSLEDVKYQSSDLQEALDQYRENLLSVVDNYIRTEVDAEVKTLKINEIAPSVLM
jgi:hypothetical protein